MIFILLVSFIATLLAVPTPSQLAAIVTQPVFGNAPHFLVWDYGGGVIVDSIWEFADQFGLVALVKPLNSLLDSLITDPTKDGYKILHNVDIPFGGAIGDSVGLFPIAYLARINYYNIHPDSTYDNTSDIKIAQTVGSKYIMDWPHYLADGTITRTSGWPGEPAGDQFVWDDDMYMGLALISRLSIMFKNRTYSDKGGKMQETFNSHSYDPASSLFWHGFNNEDAHHSCCKWGRGNGWVMMSHIEVLKALKATSKSPYFAPVVQILQEHAAGLMKAQADSGLWYQLLDDPTTFQETSSSAMFLWSLIEGVMEGWLDKATFGPVIEKGWEGLAGTVQSNGQVTGICEGTGIGPDAAFYKDRSTTYLLSSPGLGSVFKAITAYDRYMKMNK